MATWRTTMVVAAEHIKRARVHRTNDPLIIRVGSRALRGSRRRSWWSEAPGDRS